VSQSDGKGHKIGSLVAGKAEHHSLVAGAGAIQYIFGRFISYFGGFGNAVADIRRLRLYVSEYAAGIIVKTIFRLVIADTFYYMTNHPRNVYVTVAGYFTEHYYYSGGHRSLAGHVSFGIECQDIIQYGVRDLIADFVRMAFSDRF
jgi:hypothetical protein